MKQLLPRHFAFITIHPQIIQSYLGIGVLRRAAEREALRSEIINLRDFAVDKHGSIDAAPYGGGDSMVMRPEPLVAAIGNIQTPHRQKPLVVVPVPGAKHWDQKMCEELAEQSEGRSLVFVCPRFAGIDERFMQNHVDYQFSLGDFVMAGGELANLVAADSVSRLIPGALGNADSAVHESFSGEYRGSLEHPLYTRPAVFEGLSVPKDLLSGDHAKIAAWKKREAHLRSQALGYGDSLGADLAES